MVIGVACVAPAIAADPIHVVWETDYAFIHFDWHGTWDQSIDYAAWWAYALWYLDVPDWAYLFAVYGMGWDHIWGPGLWGEDGVWGAEDKINVYIMYGLGDHVDYVGGNNIWLGAELPLDLVSGGWVQQVCTAGRGLAFGATTALALRYMWPEWDWTGTSFPNGITFLFAAISYQVAEVLWPWGDHVPTTAYGIDYDYSSLEGIRDRYQLRWHYVLQWGCHDFGLGDIAGGDPLYFPGTGLFYLEDPGLYIGTLAWGYLLSDYDYLFNGAANANGASSIYRVATMLRWLRNDISHDDLPGAVMAAYGHPCSFGIYLGPYPDPWVKILDPAYNYLDAWLYNLMWGEWYHYTGA